MRRWPPAVSTRRRSNVEAHGTGTALGDPIELTALDLALGGQRPAGSRVLVGSAKTNIGHLEAAAGIAGLIKAVLALAHREIPAHLHFAQPSPKVPWDRLRVAVARTATAWPQVSHPRTAGVSAFGFTGANAHVVLTEAPAGQPRSAPPVGRPYALALSAASPAALEAARLRVADQLEATPDSGLADLAHTLGVRRNHLEYRLVAVGSDIGELLGALRVAPAAATAGRDGTARFAAVFGPGLGNLSWARLYEQEAAFAAALDAADAALAAAGSGRRSATSCCAVPFQPDPGLAGRGDRRADRTGRPVVGPRSAARRAGQLRRGRSPPRMSQACLDCARRWRRRSTAGRPRSQVPPRHRCSRPPTVPVSAPALRVRRRIPPRRRPVPRGRRDHRDGVGRFGRGLDEGRRRSHGAGAAGGRAARARLPRILGRPAGRTGRAHLGSAIPLAASSALDRTSSRAPAPSSLDVASSRGQRSYRSVGRQRRPVPPGASARPG